MPANWLVQAHVNDCVSGASWHVPPFAHGFGAHFTVTVYTDKLATPWKTYVVVLHRKKIAHSHHCVEAHPLFAL